jgi:hypothetical protein
MADAIDATAPINDVPAPYGRCLFCGSELRAPTATAHVCALSALNRASGQPLPIVA